MNSAEEKPYGLSVRAVIRHERDGTVLMLKRPNRKGSAFPNRWEFPGGKTRQDESFDEALLREVEEETGLKTKLGRVMGHAQGRVKNYEVVYLFMEAFPPPGEAGKSVTISPENTGYRWMPLDELADMALRKEADELQPDEWVKVAHYPRMVPHYREFAAEYAGRHGFTGRKDRPSEELVNEEKSTVISRQVTAFERTTGKYKKLKVELQKILEEAVRRHCPMALVQVRAKTLTSFVGKLVRKKYTDPLAEMTDLCGGRVITHIGRETEAICRFIRENFRIDEKNSEDKLSRLQTGEFGYRSVHFVVRLDPKNFPGLRRDLYDLKSEIQVRTLLQHTWADIGHDRLYKNHFKAPDRFHRQWARIAAQLENADGAFARLVEGLEEYECRYGEYLTTAQQDEQIRIQRTILDHLPLEKSALERLRLARLLLAQEKWGEAVSTLNELPEECHTPETRCTLGEALTHQQGKRAEAREAFEKALLVNPASIEALVGLAELETTQRKKLDRYAAACEIDSSHPEALSGHIRQVLRVTKKADCLPMWRASLESAIKRCQLQVEVGIDLPWALYRLAGFQFLLGESHEAEAFDSLSKAIRRTGPSRAPLLTALDAVESLCTASPKNTPAEAMRRFLLAALWNNHPKASRTDSARRLATKRKPLLKGPVVIVAGGCAPDQQDLLESYHDLLESAFRHFEGTVISGGTKEGIPGIVGRIGKASKGRLTTIGYLPKTMPGDGSANPDDRYDDLRQITGASGFSRLEPLQTWLDVLNSGIDPANVRLLGINGGPIAAFEYRLAWALGASVSLIQDSGREAERIEAEILAGEFEGMIVAPRDDMTVRAFLHSGEPWPGDPDTLERLARHAHALFLEENRHKHPDPAMQPWESLQEDLQNSNEQQVEQMVFNLKAHGYDVVPFPSGAQPYRFGSKDKAAVEAMAQYEHGRWNVERLSSGWTLGPRDPANKKSPYLVSWEEIDEETRDWDRNAIRRYPEMLAQAGLGIVKRK